MDPQLSEIWAAAPGTPFLPTVGKGSQFLVGFTLLLVGLALSGGFALSKPSFALRGLAAFSGANKAPRLDRSLVTLPLLGLPASLALAYVFSGPRPLALLPGHY